MVSLSPFRTCSFGINLTDLQDIVDLRNARWQSKDADKGPKTIQQIREEVCDRS